jgi:hypothetical protein
MQDYQECFNALVCHTSQLSSHQKANLFMGALPKHIRVDVELREPEDL